MLGKKLNGHLGYVREGTSDSEGLIVDGVDSLLLHCGFPLTVLRLVRQEVHFHVSVKTRRYFWIHFTQQRLHSRRASSLTGMNGSCVPKRCPRSGTP